MSDLDAIEARSTPRSFYSADGYALLAEVRALRERVATLEGALGDVLNRFGEHGHPGRPCVRTGWLAVEWVAEKRALLDEEADRE